MVYLRGSAASKLAKKSKFDPRSGCIVWMCGASEGYGMVWDGPSQKQIQAHRVAWELANGPIPEGLVIDHLCRNTLCINQMHLRVVTNKVNVLAGVGVTAENARKDVCKRGHAFTPTKWERRCVVCARARDRGYYRREALLRRKVEQMFGHQPVTYTVERALS